MTEEPPARVVPDAADSIGEALSALTRAIKAIDDAHRTIQASETAVLLGSELAELSRPRTATGGLRKTLSRTQSLLEDDRPLARSFRDGQRPWYEGHKSPLLTPRQLEYLARRAEGLPPSETITYREVLADHRAQRACAWSAAARATAEREQLRDELLQDVESRHCPYCGAVPGSYCRTTSGRPGGPHAERKALSPAAATQAEAMKGLKRDDTEWPERLEDRRTEQPKAQVQAQARVAELAAELGAAWAPPYDS